MEYSGAKNNKGMKRTASENVRKTVTRGSYDRQADLEVSYNCTILLHNCFDQAV